MRSLATKPSSTEIAARKPATDTPVTNNRSLSTLSTYSPVLQRQCACGGGCPSCKDELGMQTKLKISEPGDMYEQEADRVADEVMRMPEATIQRQMEPEEDVEEMVQTKVISNSITPLQRSSTAPNQAAEVPDIVHDVLRSPGQPLDPATRALMEPRFGHDFSQVRVHTGGDADRSAQDVNARAYTVGNNIVFGAGLFAPRSSEGQHLLAHELTHVVQQNSNFVQRDTIQLSLLEDYNSQDPAKLSDSVIEATDDYQQLLQKFYPQIILASQNIPELLLACRLAVRYMQEKKVSISEEKLESFVSQAKKQLGTLTSVGLMENKLHWDRQAPGLQNTEFGKWLLAGGTEPNPTTGIMNCWEVILFGAYKGGFLTLSWLKTFYQDFVTSSNATKPRNNPTEYFETKLRSSSEYTLAPRNPNSPEPLPGDIVIFQQAAVHTVISLGTKNVNGNHEVLSLWNKPNNHLFLQKTTIEDLLAAGASSPVKFWSPKW